MPSAAVLFMTTSRLDSVRLPVMACRCIHVRAVIRNEKAGSTPPCCLPPVLTVLDDKVVETSGRGHARRHGVATIRQSGCLRAPCQETPGLGRAGRHQEAHRQCQPPRARRQKPSEAVLDNGASSSPSWDDTRRLCVALARYRQVRACRALSSTAGTRARRHSVVKVWPWRCHIMESRRIQS